MKITKLRNFAGYCVCFLLTVFSLPINAAGVDQTDAGISVESWSIEGGHELPILSFDKNLALDEIYSDIRVENVIQEKDGSTRFQLSHSGPMSRQVFANVRRVEQDNGLTRSIITNVADGFQTEYLTRHTGEVTGNIPDKSDDGSLMAQLQKMDDQNTECPWCYTVGVLISEAMCAATTSLAHYNCRIDCQNLGGVMRFDSGICGTFYSECQCWYKPRRTFDEFWGLTSPEFNQFRV